MAVAAGSASAAAVLIWLGVSGSSSNEQGTPRAELSLPAVAVASPEPPTAEADPSGTDQEPLGRPTTLPIPTPPGATDSAFQGEADADAAAEGAVQDVKALPELEEHEITVRSGDSFARILSRAGHTPGDVQRILNAGESAQSALTRLRPGQALTLLRDKDGALAGVRVAVDREHKLLVRRGDDGFEASMVPRELEREIRRVEGTVDGSLFLSARRAGLDDRMIMQLARVLDGDIDLGRDLRSGDTFSVLYERTLGPDGSTLHKRLKAMRLDGARKTLEALRFEDPDGRVSFYTPDGTSLARTFTRYPVDFERISSHFDRNRRHPILGVRRPHLGVDLAAPTGTPVRAAADGRVVERRRNGGYGRVITLRHSDRYQTLYAHLSRYARGLNVGDRVKRGEVIGYVGATGQATGPHLHYEFIDNGRHRNPVTVDLPRAEPLPEEHRRAFREHVAPRLAALRGDSSAEIQLASQGEGR
ncbi:peptidoglycan DD-metalloendopeptidase family protein [Halorhodospira halophila]|nr:peptidoglycan DD-metalloendopeptidase family protein [Halorhodospira halophila]